MRADLASLNHCAVPFLSRAGANLCWYHYITKIYMYLEILLLTKTTVTQNQNEVELSYH